MDINGDGRIDILSGSYSRQDKDMAGLFQVLLGKEDGTFAKAMALDGTDGKPLILPGKGDEGRIDKICTRPFAVDLDADGKVDLVVGNFRGTFGWFRGNGQGGFAPEATWLEGSGGKLQVDSHSDPCLFDHDKDGDYDLWSGSAQGGVVMFPNVGSKTKPKFGKKVTVLKPAGYQGDDGNDPTFGDAHCKGPAADTRVWVDDVDGDGKADLLVGDTLTLLIVAEGISEGTARQKYSAWHKKQTKFMAQSQGDDQAAQKKWRADYEALESERDEFAVQKRTGFVWLYRGK